MPRLLYEVFGPRRNPKWVLRLLRLAVFTSLAPIVLIIAAAPDQSPNTPVAGIIGAFVLIWVLSSTLYCGADQTTAIQSAARSERVGAACTPSDGYDSCE